MMAKRLSGGIMGNPWLGISALYSVVTTVSAVRRAECMLEAVNPALRES